MGPLQDRQVHARFLEYRSRFGYFALKGMRKLDAEEFAKLDAEYTLLKELGEERRSDEEEARFLELETLLFRD